MSAKAYIILQHLFIPAPGEKTQIKNWGEVGKQQMVEEIYFVTRIKKRWYSTATTILNISERKIEKNTAENQDYNSIIQHIMIKYPEKYNQFIQACKNGGLINKGNSQ
jgi:hypothetical protein